MSTRMLRAVCLVALILSAMSLSIAQAKAQSDSATAQPDSAPANNNTSADIQRVPREYSTIEKMYQSIPLENQTPLNQYGYDVFNNSTVTSAVNVAPSYILGPGDQLTILVWGDPVDIGEMTPVIPAEISKSGGLFFAPVGQVPLAGISLQEAEKILISGLSRKYKRFELRLSITQMRQFPVTISGFVNNPGTIKATAGISILDALSMAGGIAKNGSLRTITVYSTDGKQQTIDLYDTFINGKPADRPLREGDNIHVSPIGPVVGIGGGVKRPGIYEGKSTTSIKEYLDYAGGFTPNSMEHNIRLLQIEDGNIIIFKQPETKDLFFNTIPESGAILEIATGALEPRNGVQIYGEVSAPGWYSIDTTNSLQTILKSVGLKSTTDLNNVTVVRTDPKELSKKVIKINLSVIINGNTDFVLNPLDQVNFFRNNDIDSIKITGEVESELVIPHYKGITLQDVLAQAVLKGDPRTLKVMFRNKTDYSDDIFLQDIFSKSKIPETPLSPGTQITIVKLGSTERSPIIYISGEVNKPGTYILTPGMTLSSLVERAGGLTQVSYLPGLQLKRPTIIKAQKNQANRVLENTSQEISALEAQTVSTTDEATKATLQAQLVAKKEAYDLLKNQLEETIGRISLAMVDEDWKTFKGSNKDLLLENGDSVYIPPVPKYVSVLGAIFNQSTQAYVPGQKIGDAIRQAGGVTETGNAFLAYVIHATGLIDSAKSRQVLFFNDFDTLPLQPGDTIIVPAKDPNSLDGWTITKDIISMLGDIAGIATDSLSATTLIKSLLNL